MTEWNSYRALDLKDIARRMTGRALIDLRNIYRTEDLEGTGLDYTGLGRIGADG